MRIIVRCVEKPASQRGPIRSALKEIAELNTSL